MKLLNSGKILICAGLSLVFVSITPLNAQEEDAIKGVEYESKIQKVLLYQNQAKITRVTQVNLSKGQNQLIFTGLPSGLLDWSVRGRLPQDFKGNILTIEVEKKALIEKRKTKISELEKQIKNLREKDAEWLDAIRNNDSQNVFLDSILKFSQQAITKELTSGLPQVKVWDSTLQYVTDKKTELSKEKRSLEQKREDLGKEIQKFEFELSQIAGTSYFGAYQKLNNEMLQKRGAYQVQEFSNVNSFYGTKKNLYENPDSGIETEKRVIVIIVSPRNIQLNFEIEYLISNTNWKMQYDLRADLKEKSVQLTLFSDIYQLTGENWQNINLELSTGAPINSISQAVLPAWYLSIYKPSTESSDKSYSKSSKQSIYGGSSADTSSEANELQQTQEEKIADEVYMQNYRQEVVAKGSNFNVLLALKQNIENSSKRQKKFVQDHKLKDDKSIEFYYEVLPAVFDKSYIKATLTNTSNLPWLNGEAQLFLDNEFMGKANIPFTPIGKKQKIVLGVEEGISAKKVLEKKFEDTAGVFNGSRRIRYEYMLEVENMLEKEALILLQDHLPYSQDSKLKIELEKIDTAFSGDEERKDQDKLSDLSYNSGLRKWSFKLASKAKKKVRYTVVIVCDKDYIINGLK